MKKTFCLIFIFLFALCGCEKMTNEVNLVSKGLSFVAEVKQNSDTYSFNVVIGKDGIMNITSTDDENFKLTFCGNNMTAIYQDVEYTSPVSNLPDNTTLDFLYILFSELVKGKSIIEKDNNYYIKGSNSKYDATIHITKSGIPLKVEENRFNIEIIFKKVYIIK